MTRLGGGLLLRLLLLLLRHFPENETRGQDIRKRERKVAEGRSRGRARGLAWLSKRGRVDRIGVGAVWTLVSASSARVLVRPRAPPATTVIGRHPSADGCGSWKFPSQHV